MTSKHLGLLQTNYVVSCVMNGSKMNAQDGLGENTLFSNQYLIMSRI